jgi:hypothetical protein
VNYGTGTSRHNSNDDSNRTPRVFNSPRAFPPSNSARQFALDRLISPESHEERCQYSRLYQLELKGEFGRKPEIVLPNIESA